jgi:hypothetical protein
MWVRFGRWVELGLHFGRQNRRSSPDGYLIHASLRFGNSEWNYGPGRPYEPISRSLGSPAPRIDLHPDPEPLRWGVRKVVSASNHSVVDTTQRSSNR